MESGSSIVNSIPDDISVLGRGCHCDLEQVAQKMMLDMSVDTELHHQFLDQRLRALIPRLHPRARGRGSMSITPVKKSVDLSTISLAENNVTRTDRLPPQNMHRHRASTSRQIGKSKRGFIDSELFQAV